ncbi:class I SAM-dependent methyltransferase, partial [Treponema sp. OttesenSCG-928-L16]|nr:class I SAM-dependent methyltransferase [Treponema sp. OttesenSCG-928-L16]
MLCPICASSESSILSVPGRNLHRCRFCAFSWTDPASWPGDDEIGYRYTASLHGDGEKPLMAEEAQQGINLFPSAAAEKTILWSCCPDTELPSLNILEGKSPFFWNSLDASVQAPPREQFDLGICAGCIGASKSPRENFLAFASSLKAGGWLLMHIPLAPVKDEDFLSWPHIHDQFRVSFFSARSLEILSSMASIEFHASEEGGLQVFRRPLPVLVAGG